MAVASGGAIGATARWSVDWVSDSVWAGGTWPWATLLVNVVGCVLIGFAARLVVPGTAAWAFVVTGMIGGFTTFSAFAVELNDLAEADRITLAVAYASVTLAMGIAATALADVGRGRR